MADSDTVMSYPAIPAPVRMELLVGLFADTLADWGKYVRELKVLPQHVRMKSDLDWLNHMASEIYVELHRLRNEVHALRVSLHPDVEEGVKEDGNG